VAVVGVTLVLAAAAAVVVPLRVLACQEQQIPAAVAVVLRPLAQAAMVAAA
jgi:hypothetical protein